MFVFVYRTLKNKNMLWVMQAGMIVCHIPGMVAFRIC